ncbi:hypothetical protein A2767_01495 [Candidatus Roizmanbacteria bacterium RIFCSPHIGHO2_01_FULL_35_10]|uniref:DUF2283 domain-containing protein n=1 Tax=Candidatus Roizmanbacteria bacterium RIFCSPLOWO2_01_FULL_35_13 TaxID=1802055 RepID=A0A1F7IAM4_9BACT|nr:MAG: hypothetical protein A2767_01495 [Candidatus Roizmanbacteria bacterium RIFCSPHIGHO2_01_FULL_35_10]OGK40416.1 MAG: hypothetical protein A3A74_01780 [Candidatus Roizmanbacteria bacterium RIFCSPLOWO2_01_FULL_35_13]
MKKSKIYYDKESDSIYISLKTGKETSFEEIEPNIVIEYDKKRQPIGIEILNASNSLLTKIKPLPTSAVFVNEKTTLYKASQK